MTSLPDTAGEGAGIVDGPYSDLVATPDSPVADTKPYRCDDAGNCNVCLSILSLGQTAVYGAGSGSSDNTDAFQAFMNNNFVTLRKFTPLTDDLLARYDVVVLQALEDDVNVGTPWSYSQDDEQALQRFVEKGGAVVALSAYGTNHGTEILPTNQLLAFSGISFSPDNTFASCPNNMCYCADSSIAFSSWSTDYADFNRITHDLKAVGIFHGNSVSCVGTDCQIFARHPTYGIVGAAKVVGKGHVLAWGDSWVTYTSQWGLTDRQWDTHSECTTTTGGGPYTAKLAYSVPQFWHNVYAWSVPNAACFTSDGGAEPPFAGSGGIRGGGGGAGGTSTGGTTVTGSGGVVHSGGATGAGGSTSTDAASPDTSCLPLEQTGCAADQACYAAPTGSTCYKAGTAQPGATCHAANDCSPGATCVTISGSSACHSFCSTSGDKTSACSGNSTGGTFCAALLVAGYEANLGYCRTPVTGTTSTDAGRPVDGEANCMGQVVSKGYSCGAAPACSACVVNGVSKEAQCKIGVDCLAAAGLSCDSNCQLNYFDKAGATPVQLCVSALQTAACSGTGC
jgi:hypothetical protein